MKVICHVQRQNPREPSRWVVYEVEISDGLTVLNLLQEISQQDPRLAYTAHHCKTGTCGGCSMIINGIKRLACRTLLTSSEVRLQRVPGVPLIKDLLGDHFAAQRKAPLSDRKLGLI